MQTSNMEISHLKALIKDKMHHDYIEKYVRIPQLDEDKLYMLISILNNTALPGDRKEYYIVTAMLIQMALDTHDLVPNTANPAPNDNDEKAKQLSVLAGDYYSGLYYLILSEIEEINMTRVLATAITEINELKMQLYYKTFDSFETFIDVLKAMESRLTVRTASFAGETAISSIAAEWLIVRKLMIVKNRILKTGLDTAFGPWSDRIPIADYQTTLDAINAIIHHETSVIENRLIHFPVHLSAVKSSIINRLSAVG
ncbi:heptaprenyl diphosphate synthase component 1 [Lentibacillus salinarum]|uniref:heptaprenyl diphosphate synthase component 1 n=1 Tax=Lentibacillus salinarum TaxID=446820 RepID=UPI0036D23C32